MIRTIHVGLVRCFFLFFVLCFGNQSNFWIFFCCQLIDIDFASSDALDDFFLYFLDVRLITAALNLDLVRSNNLHFILIDFFSLRLSFLFVGIITYILVAQIIVAMTMITQTSTLIIFVIVGGRTTTKVVCIILGATLTCSQVLLIYGRVLFFLTFLIGLLNITCNMSIFLLFLNLSDGLFFVFIVLF